MEAITVKKLKDLKSDLANIHIIDVLDESQFAESHLPDSENIPLDNVDFVKRVREKVEDESTPVVVYCTNEDCPKSKQAAERLETAGFENVYDFAGGLEAWEEAGEDLERSNGGEPEASEGEENAKDEAGKPDEPSSESDRKSEDEALDEEDSKSKAEDSDAADDTSEDQDEETGDDAGGQPKELARSATATWNKSLKDGTGRMRFDSVEGLEIPYTFGTRFGGETGPNPEEMLAAAQAGCYSMALSAALGEAGYTPEKIESRATVNLKSNGTGFEIYGVKINCTAHTSGIEEDEFKEIARKAKESCPVSNALSALEIECDAALAEDSG